MCVACRLSLRVLCVFVLFVSLFAQNVNSLIAYDRQTLLDLQLYAEDPTQRGTLPPLLVRIPAHLCLAPALPLRRKRTHCWGKHSGRMVRLNASLAGISSASWTKDGAVPTLIIRSLDPVNAWLIPVVGPDEVFQPCGPCSPRPCRCGVNLNNPQPLRWTPQAADDTGLPVPVRFTLVNASKQDFYPKGFFHLLRIGFSLLLRRG